MNPQENNPNFGQDAPVNSSAPNPAMGPAPNPAPQQFAQPNSQPAVQPIQQPASQPITQGVNPAASTAATTTSQAAATAGMVAGKAGTSVGVKILLGIIALLVVGGGVFAAVKILGSGSSNNNQSQQSGSGGQANNQGSENNGGGSQTEDNEIVAALNKMNEASGYTYSTEFTNENSIMNTTTDMGCTHDGINKIEYCTLSSIGFTVETYYDWTAGKSYSNSAFTDGWTVAEASEEDFGNIATQAPSITIQSKENVDNGIKYTGTIDVSKISDSISIEDGEMQVSGGDADIEVVVNNEGYIETISASFSMSTSYIDMNTTINVVYSNYNNVDPITIPAEAKAAK